MSRTRIAFAGMHSLSKAILCIRYDKHDISKALETILQFK